MLHFLLSNLKFWLEEYHFDGFRFDGVTSMIYQDHGLGSAFTDYSQYFGLNTNVDALTYLQLANELIHAVNPFAVTIAEEMSGMPGMCLPIRSGGIGFDYRLSMGVPDFWIKYLKDYSDDQWDMFKMWYELTTRRPQEKNVAYCESHDQALVGDKTIFFRMADAEMYTGMEKSYHSITIDRAVALHKMIRFITLTLGGDGYLNFMGNEFGHPEWIDFPREGNGWSYKYARRQWSLVQNGLLKYEWLVNFDKAMLKFARKYRVLNKTDTVNLWIDQPGKIIAFSKGGLVYVFNFHPTYSPTNFFLPTHSVGEGKYKVIFSTDDIDFGGMDRVSKQYVYYTKFVENRGLGFEIYIPCRTAIVFKRYEAGETLNDQSRRPHRIQQTDPKIEEIIVGYRKAHPAIGATKIHRILTNQGVEGLPSAKTCNNILKRNGLITREASAASTPYKRFEKTFANQMWQADYKGKVKMKNGLYCHPLNIIDDYSRFNLCCKAMHGETFEEIKPVMIGLFETYGLPFSLLCDNGPPWGTSQSTGFTHFEVWLMELGVLTMHGRALHPQTQGKEERFNGTLTRELLRYTELEDFEDSDRKFERNRQFYNYERPHHALKLDTPAQHYTRSDREYSDVVAEWEYPEGCELRKVKSSGYFNWNSQGIS